MDISSDKLWKLYKRSTGHCRERENESVLKIVKDNAIKKKKTIISKQ